MHTDVTKAAAGSIVTLTAALKDNRRVLLNTPGISISQSMISSDGGIASFTMPEQAVIITAAFETINAAESTVFKTATDPGNIAVLTLTQSSLDLNMVYANNTNSISFPSGTSDNKTATLDTRFWLAETETTNAVMADVLQWAYDNKKFSNDIADHNGLNTTTIKYGG